MHRAYLDLVRDGNATSFLQFDELGINVHRDLTLWKRIEAKQ